MLRDRKEFLEIEINSAKQAAAKMYLNMVTVGPIEPNDEYQTLRNRISQLQFDINMVTELIEQGHP